MAYYTPYTKFHLSLLIIFVINILMMTNASIFNPTINEIFISVLSISTPSLYVHCQSSDDDLGVHLNQVTNLTSHSMRISRALLVSIANLYGVKIIPHLMFIINIRVIVTINFLRWRIFIVLGWWRITLYILLSLKILHLVTSNLLILGWVIRVLLYNFMGIYL